MIAFRPGDVVHKVSNRDVTVCTGVESERIVHTAEVNEVLVLGANRILALPNIAVAEVVDEIVAEYGSVGRDDPFGVVDVD